MSQANKKRVAPTTKKSLSSKSASRKKVGMKANTESRTLRLSKYLVDLAGEVGSIFQRSTAGQIEYWARIGQIIERDLSSDQINKLMKSVDSRTSIISATIMRASEPAFDFGSMSDALEIDRASGKLRDQVLKNLSFWYQLSKDHPGFIERVERSGIRQLGRIENGQFTPKEV